MPSYSAPSQMAIWLNLESMTMTMKKRSLRHSNPGNASDMFPFIFNDQTNCLRLAVHSNNGKLASYQRIICQTSQQMTMAMLLSSWRRRAPWWTARRGHMSDVQLFLSKHYMHSPMLNGATLSSTLTHTFLKLKSMPWVVQHLLKMRLKKIQMLTSL